LAFKFKGHEIMIAFVCIKNFISIKHPQIFFDIKSFMHGAHKLNGVYKKCFPVNFIIAVFVMIKLAYFKLINKADAAAHKFKGLRRVNNWLHADKSFNAVIVEKFQNLKAFFWRCGSWFYFKTSGLVNKCEGCAILKPDTHALKNIKVAQAAPTALTKQRNKASCRIKLIQNVARLLRLYVVAAIRITHEAQEDLFSWCSACKFFSEQRQKVLSVFCFCVACGAVLYTLHIAVFAAMIATVINVKSKG